RHELGLPANLLSALPAGGAPAVQAAPEADEAVLTAPVPGTLTLWQAEDGAEVEPGQVVAVIEAMKMETRIEAHRAGKLTRIAAQGEVLGFGAALARIG
ncbi:acetyl-CoA carboxylase biotin carboxyl carrier protein subunit, partial [Paracoccus sp. PXZ]